MPATEPAVTRLDAPLDEDDLEQEDSEDAEYIVPRGDD